MKTLTYRTIIEPDGKYYHGYVPALPGCHSQGKTIEETQKNLREAIEGILIVMKKYGDPIPTDESVESIENIDTDKLFSHSSYV